MTLEAAPFQVMFGDVQAEIDAQSRSAIRRQRRKPASRAKSSNDETLEKTHFTFSRHAYLSEDTIPSKADRYE